MSGQGSLDASDDLPIELARVQAAVARELYAQLALRGWTLDQADLPGVAYAVAVQLGREFRIEYGLPPPGEPDDESLGLDGAAFYGSALRGDGDRNPSDRYPIFDHGWPARSGPVGPVR